MAEIATDQALVDDTELGVLQRERDRLAGLKQGSEIFGDPDRLAGISQDVLDEREARLKRGLSPEEVTAIRAQGAGSLRELQAIQGQQGVRGGTAAAGQAGVLQATEDIIASEGAAAKENALASLSQDIGARQFGVQSSALGQQQLGLQERAAAQGVAIANQPAPQASSGFTVICTELHRQKIIDDKTLEKEKTLGTKYRKEDPFLYYGYFVWAQHVARGMSKSTLLTSIVKPFAISWIKQTKAGKVIDFIGKPVCRFIGRLCYGSDEKFEFAR